MFKQKTFRMLAVLNLAALVFFILGVYTPLGRHLQARFLESEISSRQDLTLVQAAEFGALDPQQLAATDQTALGFVYEPLMRFDQFFNLKPALSYSWYFTAPTEFTALLRSNVQFQNGSALSCADVAASLTRAQTLHESSIQSLFAGVTMTADGANKCVFRLPAADQNFPRKLTRLFIIPAAAAHFSHAEWAERKVPGTGRYQLPTQIKNQLTFQAFPQYYLPAGDAPRSITFIAEPQKYRRLALLKSQKADVLLDVPTSFVPQIEGRYDYQIQRTPNFAAFFLLFNATREPLATPAQRAQFAALVQQVEVAKKLADPSIYSLSQFAPSGVFGFDPRLLDQKMAATVPTEKQFFTLALASANEKVGQILRTELTKQNIELNLQILSETALLQSVKDGGADFFLLGWQYELGTTDDFFAKILHTPADGFGQLAGGLGYASAERDTVLQKPSAAATPAARLQALQDLMQQAISTDFIGAPLFGTLNLVAVRPEVAFTPRLDGLIIFDTSDANH